MIVVTKTSINIYNITELILTSKLKTEVVCSYILNSNLKNVMNSKEFMLNYDNYFTASGFILMDGSENEISLHPYKSSQLEKELMESSIAFPNEGPKEKIIENSVIQQNISMSLSTEQLHSNRKNSARKMLNKIGDQSFAYLCTSDSRGYLHVNRVYYLS